MKKLIFVTLLLFITFSAFSETITTQELADFWNVDIAFPVEHKYTIEQNFGRNVEKVVWRDENGYTWTHYAILPEEDEDFFGYLSNKENVEIATFTKEECLNHANLQIDWILTSVGKVVVCSGNATILQKDGVLYVFQERH